MKLKDFNPYERDYSTYYGGRSGSKYAIIMDGERWMLKFPENTRDFKTSRQNHLPSYTTSPVSEYIGSQIYESLGIPVHKTMLGIRDNKIVVACKDFDPLHRLIEYGQVKNSITEMEIDLVHSSSNQQGEPLKDALNVIQTAPVLKKHRVFWIGFGICLLWMPLFEIMIGIMEIGVFSSMQMAQAN